MKTSMRTMTHNLWDLIGRSYMYFKLGWSNYISMPLGMTAYLAVIYNFVLNKYLPADTLTYSLIGMGVVLFSWVMGYEMKRSGFWGKEHQISTEANPAINYPIGEKELLGYDATILGYEAAVLNYEASIFGYQNEILILKNQMESAGAEKKAELEERIARQEELLRQMREMQERNKAMLERMRAMRARGKKVQ